MRQRLEEATVAVDTDWFMKRIADVDLNASKIAKMMGFVSRSTMSRKLRGELKFTQQEAADLAALLKVPLEDLMRHAGVDLPRESRAQLPLIGTVLPDGEIGPRPSGAPRGVERPARVPDDAVGLLVKAPGAWMDGWVVYYTPSPRIEIEAVGKVAIVQIRGGRRFMKLLQRGVERGKWRLVGADGKSEEWSVESAAPVLWARL